MLRRFACVTFGVSLLCGAPVCAQDPEPEPLRVTGMLLRASIDYPTSTLTGSVSLELENWTGAPADRVSFLLNRLMTVSAVRAGDGSAVQFVQDVVRFADLPMWQVTQIRVQLPRAVAPAGKTTLRLEYAGAIVGYAEVGMLYVRDRIDTSFTIIREDALAFPVVGGVSVAANRRRPRVPFVYQVSVRVRDGLVVATGGASARTSNGDGTTTWQYDSRRPAPFLNICIAPFEVIVAGDVRVFHLREDSLGGRQLAANAQSALALLKQWFGLQRSSQVVTIIEIPDGWGSQADLVAGIIQAAAAFRDPSRSGELYHELTHLWNVIDTDTPSPRWNEGLATFLQDVLRERVDGWQRRGEAEDANMASVKRAVAADSALRSTPMLDYGKRGMTGRSYRVGALMFATLWQIVGEDKFNAIIAGYFQRFHDGGSTRDFAELAGQTADRDLRRFFDDWLFTTEWAKLVANAATVGELASHYKP